MKSESLKAKAEMLRLIFPVEMLPSVGEVCQLDAL